MNKVRQDETYWTEFNGKKYQEYRSKEIFDLIIEGEWKNGEPSFLFRNRIDDSPYQYTGQKIFSTNPCSEQPLPVGAACNIGSLDLSKFLSPKNEMDYEKLEHAVRLGVDFLDSVIDVSEFPTDEIEKWSMENRPIALGIMGWADYCLMREMAYGTLEANRELERILLFIHTVAHAQSKQNGLEKGIPKMCQMLPEPRRNITLLTVAPTGSVSLFAGCSSGIEPIFSEVTIRNDKTGTYTFINDLAEKPYFRCAVSSNGVQEVTWEEHVKTVASAQKFVDSGISKTINFPTHTHRDTIAKAVFLAWELGCKGIAVYRNGSRKNEVLSPKNVKKDKCPVCGNDLVEINGKLKCMSCKPKEESSSYYN
jgi:ribonucleoside-diphosphate reductase alpha chain